MTITGWVVFAFLIVMIIWVCVAWYVSASTKFWRIASIVTACLLVTGLLFGMLWYFNNTASGQRALTSQRSNIGNGLERTVTVYTADGTVLAQYKGKFDIERNDGGYILFDFEGKRYIYYNCFVESIADIE